MTIVRSDGSRFQVVQAEARGDTCYAGKKGFYWHDIDDMEAIRTETITGPFPNPEKAYAAGIERSKPCGQQLKVRLSNANMLSLLGMALRFAVVISKDISVRVVGAVESVHNTQRDALTAAEWLDRIYCAEGAFSVVDLQELVK